MSSIFPDVIIDTEKRPDGSVILRNKLQLPPTTRTIVDRLDDWAIDRPEHVFLTEPTANGRSSVNYRETAAFTTALAVRLLSQPISYERPLMIIGNNGISHAMIMLAALRVGLLVSVVSPGYCQAAARPWTKFGHLIGRTTPGLIVADDPSAILEIVNSLGHSDIAVRPLQDLAWLVNSPTAGGKVVEGAIGRVGPSTSAKLLFTSGSTGTPKAVINTHAMMISNMEGLALVWPVLLKHPPVMVDWLPWNHTFGGNCCFNLALHFGGTMHIDHGKPVPALIDKTANLLRAITPSVYFNVPAGYDALLPYLEDDPGFAQQFFAGTSFLFSAAAPLPANTRERLEQVALSAIGRVPPIVGGWGSTETAPFSTVVYFPTRYANNLGVPLPGTDLKLIPLGENYELRVRGPNVTPGYFRQPAESARMFDEEGFYKIGDAGQFVNAERPEEGLLYSGRVTENFKLSTGTWVNVGGLRLSVIEAGKGLISDVAIAGEGQSDIGLLIFLNRTAVQSLLKMCDEEGLDELDLGSLHVIERRLAELLMAHNRMQLGSSTRIGRFKVMTEAPDPHQDEITEKGYLNQRAVIRRRCSMVSEMYSAPGLND